MAKVQKESYLNPDFKKDTMWRCVIREKHVFLMRFGREEVRDIHNSKYLNQDEIVRLETCECPYCP